MDRLINNNSIQNSTSSYSQSFSGGLPCKPESVPDYIWNQCLSELVNNQREYPTQADYQAAVEQLKKDYLEAQALVAKGNFSDEVLKKLQALIDDASSLAHYPNRSLSPQFNEANERVQYFKQQLEALEKLQSDLEFKESNLKSLIASLEKQLNGFQSNPEFYKEHKKEIENLLSQIQAAKSALDKVQQQNVAMNNFKTELDSKLSQMNALLGEMRNKTEDQDLNTLLNQIKSSINDASKQFPNYQNSIDKIAKDFNQINLDSIEKSVEVLKGLFPTPKPQEGISSYLDFGLIQNALFTFIDWSTDPPSIDELGLKKYFDSLFAQLKASGINEVYLAFGQLADVKNLLEGNLSQIASTDTIGQIMKFSQQYLGGNADLISLFTQEAHAQGVSVNLSFGGLFGDGMNISPNGEDPHDQAVIMSAFMQKFGFDAIDLDLEVGGAQQFMGQGVDLVKEYLKTLHTLLEPQGKKIFLTSMGDVNLWGKDIFAPFFQDEFGNKTFSDYFDGLNLMLYSDTQYYVDANDPTWGLKQWIDVIGIENMNKIHIGFDDGVPYEKPSASAGYKDYPVDPTSRGRSAALMYEEMLKQLKSLGIDAQFGEPFWWPANDIKNGARYNVDGKGEIEFGTEAAMRDFYNQLHGL